MSAVTSISVEKLSRLIGTPRCPVLVDVRPDDDFELTGRLIPGSVRRRPADAARWGAEFAGRAAVVVCRTGGGLGHGTAAHLRAQGVAAEALEYGFEGWKTAGLPLVAVDKLPPRDQSGRTVWVTRARPKVDRIACPWLIRRFVDPGAVFLYVPAPDVQSVAEQFDAAPFDIDGVFWSHRGDRCTFDLMVEQFGLTTDALLRLATLVRGADTARPDLAPQAAGLLAASLGLSRMYADDLEQLEAGLGLYDAFYRWCRDAVEETHAVHGKTRGAVT